MSAATDYDTDEDWQKLVMKWSAAGHEVLHERKTFRHKAYKKDLDPEAVIQRRVGSDLVPYTTSTGHTLTFGDVLPERADLCLDMDGHMLPQHEFEKRYFEFLNWFNYVEGSDPKAEPIPNAEQWICMIPDPFSESPGMVEAGWDARKPSPAEDERTHRYDPRTDEMVEIVKQQGEATNLTLEAVRQLLEAAQTPVVDEPKKRGRGRPRKDAA